MFEALFSSASLEWSTPPEFYNKLNKIFRFTLDPCATAENAKCKKYFTKEQNGLAQSWKGERVFMNPPYGDEIGKWMKKAYEERILAVCLVPARTDTAWFHDYCFRANYLVFLRGRLKFEGAKTSAPFPSCLVIFYDTVLGKRRVALNEFGKVVVL